MSYRIERTDKANDQLFDILTYIADDSGSVDTALQYLEKLEKAILNLHEMPYMGVQPRYSTLRKQGYRVLIVERHLAFYKVDEAGAVVTIYAVVDARREYRDLI